MEGGEAVEGRKRILILGGSFAGLNTARWLAKGLKGRRDVEVHLLSRDAHFLFSPFLCEVVGGVIETRHIAESIRRLLDGSGVRFTLCEVEALDPWKRTVKTSIGEFPYDLLVIALGSVTNYYGMEELKRWSFPLKSLAHALKLRSHILDVFERADALPPGEDPSPYLTFVIVGGGPTGIELICQLHDLIHGTFVKYYPAVDFGKVRLILVEAQDEVLSGFEPSLIRKARRRLAQKGIELLLNTKVTGAYADGVVLEEGRRTPTKTLVWTAGIRANPVTEAFDLPKDPVGRLVVNQYLQVEGHPEIYALGDVARFEDPGSGKPLPADAQVAVQQAKRAAKNIIAQLDGRPLKPFRFYRFGRLASLGTYYAVVSLRGFKVYGFLAWWLWRTIYLFKMGGIRNKLRVIVDWTFDLFFERDLTKVG